MKTAILFLFLALVAQTLFLWMRPMRGNIQFSDGHNTHLSRPDIAYNSRADQTTLKDFTVLLEKGEVSLVPDRKTKKRTAVSAESTGREGVISALRADKDGSKALWLQARERIDLIYAEFFKTADLDATEVEKLRAILTDLELAKVDSMVLTKAKDGNDTAFQRVYEQASREIFDQINELLDGQKVALLSDYQRTLPAQEDFDQFTKQVFFGPDELTKLNKDRLRALWIASYSGPSAISLTIDRFDSQLYNKASLYKEAASVLAPTQLNALRAYLGN